MCRRNSEGEEAGENAGDQAFVGTDVHSPRGRFPYFLKLSITKATCRVNGWEERKSAQNLGSRRVPKKLQGSDHGMGFHALGGNCSHKPAGQGHFCGPSGIRTRGLYLERVASLAARRWGLALWFSAGAPGFEPGLPEPESGALPGYATPQGPLNGSGAGKGRQPRRLQPPFARSRPPRMRASEVSLPRTSSDSNSGGPTSDPVTATRTE